ncbi:MAG: tRNA (adenosine(37)-N6)-threonylcarbamoyltransferase complex dimerization subunit type 1 TsaB [Eubacteriales bacterium]|nr:tRNA (adenosine(37)-N6)-threonylcarbamoyltransferase complex dimerization subunit type 1 TsaB [Eubacteriales bacterium]
MKVLGVDSSGMVASVALVDSGVTIAEYSVNFKKTHSETLLPMIDEIMRMTETRPESVDAIAVAAGPGSFTGLRIGSAAVKGLGLALDKPIIAVPTCHALAYNAWGTEAIVCPIMDARRGQVYTGIYEFIDGTLEVIEDQMAIGITDLLEKLTEYDRPVIFLGDGVPVFKKIIDETFEGACMYAPAHMNRQRAAAVATLGMQMYEEGIYESADDHAPIYLRKSQAEREYEEREGKK